MPTTTTRLALLSLALATGCVTTKPIEGQYSDPNTIEIVSDHFSQNDLQMIADKMAKSMAESPAFASAAKPPRVVVTSLTNKTSESVDLESLADKIQVSLFKTGKFEIFDERARVEIAREYQYQQSNYVDPASAHGPGKQAAADYVLTGTLASIVQQGGADERVYYKFSMLASDATSGSVKWAEDQEIRKAIELQGISVAQSEKLHYIGYGTGGVIALAGAVVTGAGLAQAHGDSFHLVQSQCDPPFQDQTDCLKRVDDPAQGPNMTLVWSGAGMMAGGGLVMLLTYALVPPGNPRIAEVPLGGTDVRLTQLDFGPTRYGGGAVTLGGSF